MTAKSPRMANRITTVSAWTAHGLAWVVGVWFLLAPTYQGTSGTLLPDGSTEVTRHTATLVEENGLIAVSSLLVPVLVTYIRVGDHTSCRARAGKTQNTTLVSRRGSPLIVYAGDLLHWHDLSASCARAFCCSRRRLLGSSRRVAETALPAAHAPRSPVVPR